MKQLFVLDRAGALAVFVQNTDQRLARITDVNEEIRAFRVREISQRRAIYIPRVARENDFIRVWEQVQERGPRCPLRFALLGEVNG